MKKIVILGLGRGFDQYISRIKYYETNGEIKIVGVTSDDWCYKKVYGYNFLTKEELHERNDYDFLLATNEVLYEIYSQFAGGVTLNARIMDIPGFSFKKYFELLRRSFSIVSNWCWGGLTYHYFSHKFLSPFINMFFEDEEYIKLLKNFDYYMTQPIELVNMRFDLPLNGFDGPFPVMRLNDIRLYMNHYQTAEDAEQKWELRKQRINRNNMIFVMITSSQKSAEKFDALPYSNKICFVPFLTDIPSAVAVDIYGKWGSRIQMERHADIVFVRFMNRIAMGRYKFYEPWELIMNGNVVRICE